MSEAGEEAAFPAEIGACDMFDLVSKNIDSTSTFNV